MDKKRLGRISQEIKKEVSNLIANEVNNPKVSPMTSVTDVEVTPDLQFSKIYISVLGDDKDRENTLEGLESAKGFIKYELGKRLSLRNIPDITFINDTSIERGLYMDQLIDKVIRQDEENHVPDTDEGEE